MYSASPATHVSRLCTTLPHVINGQQVATLEEIFKKVINYKQKEMQLFKNLCQIWYPFVNLCLNEECYEIV